MTTLDAPLLLSSVAVRSGPASAATPHRFGSRCLCVSALLLALLVGLPGPARAQDGEGAQSQSAWSEAGFGVLSVASSLLYSPVKVIYAGAGTLTAGFAFVLSGGERQLPRLLLARSLGGDYVVTPEHLRGQRRLIFVGPDPQPEPYPY